MNSVERVKKLCKERKIPISRLEKDLGYSNGYIGQLRKGSFPDDRLKEISVYLDVSVEYLMTGEEISETKETTLTPKDERDIAKDVDRIMEKLSLGENGPASYNGEILSEESMELFKEELQIALKRLKLINKERYNPHKNKK